MQFDTETNTFWFRQSWIDNAMRCNEQGRYQLVLPEFSTESDAANAGTAAHAAVEQHLLGAIALDEVVDYAHDFALDLHHSGAPQGDGTFKPITYKKWSGVHDLVHHAVLGATAWVRDIAPYVPEGGKPEVGFKVVLFTLEDGRKVGIKGTIDYVHEDGLWDWKFPGSEYKQHEKQAWGIQPSVYGAAAVRLWPEWYSYPILFKYGIGFHQQTQSRGIMFEVQRTLGHEKWLIDLLRGYVTMHDRMGLDVSWPRNEGHWLCSEKWCDYYTICKGARLSNAEDRWKPSQPIPLVVKPKPEPVSFVSNPEVGS